MPMLYSQSNRKELRQTTENHEHCGTQVNQTTGFEVSWIQI